MTIKQATAAKYIAEGDSVSKAMRKAGYKPSAAKNPKLLTESKSFRETLEKLGISDVKLAQRLNEGLDATKPIYKNNNATKKVELVDHSPDFAVRHKYVETSLRLKGHDKEVPPTTVIIPIYGGLSARPDDVRDTKEVPLSGYDSHPQHIPAQAANQSGSWRHRCQ